MILEAQISEVKSEKQRIMDCLLYLSSEAKKSQLDEVAEVLYNSWLDIAKLDDEGFEKPENQMISEEVIYAFKCYLKFLSMSDEAKKILPTILELMSLETDNDKNLS